MKSELEGNLETSRDGIMLFDGRGMRASDLITIEGIDGQFTANIIVIFITHPITSQHYQV